MPAPVYVVRHGESTWNVRRLTQGQVAHPPLTERGRDQARAAAAALAADLAGAGPDLVVTSDLVRASQTARLIQELLGGSLRVDPRLREQHLGILEGRGYDETFTAADAHDWSDPTLPVAGGESPAQVQDRVAAVLAELDPTGVTVLVSHGDTIRAALAHLAGQGPAEAPWVAVPNGAVARVHAGAVGWLTVPSP